MQITEAHLDEAIRMARAGGGMGHEYNQLSWCGTVCCVLGFARLVAGLPERNQGPQPGEIVDTPRARMIAALMYCGNPSILDVMEHIQADGSLDRPVHVNGNMVFSSGATLTHLPEGLTVSGSLSLSHCTSLTHLPESLSVGDYISLDGCRALIHLPKGLTVRGNLYLSGCTVLTHLPEGLIVSGSLNLYGCTALTHLPEGLIVSGSLSLYGCTALTHLPEGLSVGGTLDLFGCTALMMEKIPEHLRSKVVL